METIRNKRSDSLKKKSRNRVGRRNSMIISQIATGSRKSMKTIKNKTRKRLMTRKIEVKEEFKTPPIISSQKPIRISWFFNNPEAEFIKNFKLPTGKFGLSYCPGKKMKKGRDGKEHNRDLFTDITNFTELAKNPVQVIV